MPVCRVCLKKGMRKFRSLSEIYKNALLYDHINIITNVEIKLNDGLPDTICSTCFLELEAAINFKEKCESSDYVLKTRTLDKITGAETISEVLIKNEVQRDETDDLSDFNDELTVSVQYLDDDSIKSEVKFSLFNSQKIKITEPKVNYASTSINHADTYPQVQCHDCGSYFKSKCKLRVHWRKTHLLNSLVCSICKMVFKTYKAYHSHKKMKRQSCIVAGSGMINIIGIGKARIFNCKQCPYKSKRMKDMQTHIVIHSGDRPFQCEMCSKNFTQLSSLQAHKESVHKKYIVEATCQFCGKFLKGRSQVYRHLKTHTGDKVPCPVCAKMLTKNCLRPHMQRHSKVKSYTCEICAKSFYTCAELCNHRRSTHNTLKKVYKCDLCEYKANRSDALKKHRGKHTDLNIPCVTCGMFFMNKQKLILHERIHFDEKKYSCPHCDVKFHGRDSVRKHVKVKHKTLALINNKSAAVKVKEEIHGELHYSDALEIVSSPI
ncbi:zinc finger protein 431-like [Battus philenor]|uniref:zinc finger protein 431-like n=1 Tax=Battus philenor TaxID=42288 RepID=UPI0035CFFFF4